MNERITRSFILIIVLFLIMQTGFIQRSQAESGNLINSTVYVTDKSCIQIYQALLLPNQKGNTLAIMLSFNNDDDKELNLNDYKIHLQTQAGAQYKLKLLSNGSTEIAAHTRGQFVFYASVAGDLRLDDFVVGINEWDIRVPNFERVKGEIVFAHADFWQNMSPTNQTFRLKNNLIHSEIDRTIVNETETSYEVAMVYEMKNIDGFELDLPKLGFYIKTPKGLYPLDPSGSEDHTSLKPSEVRKILLTTIIPKEDGYDDWTLIVARSETDKTNETIIVPVFTDELDLTDPKYSSYGQEQEFIYKTEDQTIAYLAKLKSIQRLPWEDQDILSAQVAVSNNTDEAQPVPELTGYYLLDGNHKVEAATINSEKATGIPAHSSVILFFQGKVPYNNRFSKIKLVIHVQSNDNQNANELQFNYSRGLDPIRLYLKSWKNLITTQGRASSYYVKDVSRYVGDSNDIIQVQVNVTNNEKRAVAIPNMLGYIETPEGEIWSTSKKAVNNKIGSKKNAIVSFYSQIPKGEDVSHYVLLTGIAVSNGIVSTLDGQSDGYIDPAEYMLNDKSYEASDDLNHVSYLLYTLSIHNFRAGTDLQGPVVTFNYDLKKDTDVVMNIEGHTLLLTLENSNGVIRFSKEIQIQDKSTIGLFNNEEALLLGTDKKLEIRWSQADLWYNQQDLQRYTLKLYDQFEGAKRLLISKEMEWFVTYP